MNGRGQRGSRHEIRRCSAIVHACGSGLRMCCMYIMYVCICVYIREDITSRARIFTRNMSFSRVIVSEIKLRHALLEST